MEVGEEFDDAKLRVLGEMVKQHIKEEEELFPELESAKLDLHAGRQREFVGLGLHFRHQLFLAFGKLLADCHDEHSYSGCDKLK